MGIYTGVLFVAAMPSVLPKIAAVITVKTPASNPFQELTFRLLRDDQEVLSQSIDAETLRSSKTAVPHQAEFGDQVIAMSWIAQFVPFEIMQNSVLRALVETESETIKAGALLVQLAPSPFIIQ